MTDVTTDVKGAREQPMTTLLDSIDTMLDESWNSTKIEDLIELEKQALVVVNDEFYPDDYRASMLARWNSIGQAIAQLKAETAEMESATDALMPRAISARNALAKAA